MFKLSALIFGASSLGSDLSAGRKGWSSRSQHELRKTKNDKVTI